MEGALPSVVGGYVACPVIAVPTSVGYGANFGGVSALLSMLNSCANNVAVVNIDAGFKAGFLAGLIATAQRANPIAATPTVQPATCKLDDLTNTPLPTCPPRRPTATKATSAAHFSIGGSRGMSGAISLSGQAALRSGAGLGDARRATQRAGCRRLDRAVVHDARALPTTTDQFDRRAAEDRDRLWPKARPPLHSVPGWADGRAHRIRDRSISRDHTADGRRRRCAVRARRTTRQRSRIPADRAS